MEMINHLMSDSFAHVFRFIFRALNPASCFELYCQPLFEPAPSLARAGPKPKGGSEDRDSLEGEWNVRQGYWIVTAEI